METFQLILTLFRSSGNFPVHPDTLHIIWIFCIAKYPEILQPVMSLSQKLSGFAKTFQSALLTHWRGFSNSASGLEDSHYFQWIYLIKLNSAQHLFCKIPLLFVCPGDWEPPVRLTPLTVSEHFDTRRPYSPFCYPLQIVLCDSFICTPCNF